MKLLAKGKHYGLLKKSCIHSFTEYFCHWRWVFPPNLKFESLRGGPFQYLTVMGKFLALPQILDYAQKPARNKTL
jgi:hypothetical protein